MEIRRNRWFVGLPPASLLAVLLAALWPTAALAESGTTCGEIFDARSGELRYRVEVREGELGPSVEWRTRYHDPAGTLVVETRTVLERTSRAWMSSRTFDHRSGATLEARIESGQVEMLHVPRTGAEAEKGRVAWTPDALVPDAVGELMGARWDALVEGRAVLFDLLVVEKQMALGFRLLKTGQDVREGRQAVVLELAPSSWFLRRLVDPVQLFVAADGGHPVLSTEGPAPVRDAEGTQPIVRTVWGTRCPRAAEEEKKP